MPDISDRLDTWAEIAAHLGRDVRTARRYETELGLPVRRMPGGDKARVYAFRHELDAWRGAGKAGPAAAPLAPSPSGESARPVAPDAAAPPIPARVGLRRRGAVIGAAIGAVGVSLVAAGWWAFRPAPVPHGADGVGVVLADLQNFTGDRAFDPVVRRVAEADLSQSPLLQVASESQIARTLDLMRQPEDAPLTLETARATCERLNDGVVIQPTISRLGARYILLLAATGCVDGRSLAEEKGEAAGKETIARTIDALSARLRRRLGESQASIAKLDVPITPERTASFDALTAYSEGVQLHQRGEIPEAAAAFQRAVDLDPGFAAAWLGLGQQDYNLKQPEAAIQATTKAYELRANTSQRQRLLIASRYNMDVTKDLYASLSAITLMTQLYPNDSSAWGNLSNLQNWLGRFDDAIASGRRTLALDPKGMGSYSVLARALNHAGRTAEAVKVDRMAMAAGVAGGDTRGQLIGHLYLLGQSAAAEMLVTDAIGTPLERDADLEALDIAIAQGRMRQANAFREKAEVLGRPHGLAVSRVAHASEAAALGFVAEARRELDAAPAPLRTGDYHIVAAQLYAPARVRADLAHDLARWPHDTLLNEHIAPQVEALLLMRRNDGRGAVRALAAAAPLAHRSLDTPFLLGRALMMAGDAPGAAVQFRWVLAHKGLGPDPQYDLAHLGLARALRLQHDIAGARREYDAFLRAWANADPDLPQVRAAREERIAAGSTRSKPSAARSSSSTRT